MANSSSPKSFKYGSTPFQNVDHCTLCVTCLTVEKSWLTSFCRFGSGFGGWGIGGRAGTRDSYDEPGTGREKLTSCWTVESVATEGVVWDRKGAASVGGRDERFYKDESASQDSKEFPVY
jgi:hypothetical protein